MDLSKILAQLAHASPDVQLDGVTGARKIAPALPPKHPERASLVRKLGELASFHGFGDRPTDRAVPPPALVPASGSLALPDEVSGGGALAAAFAQGGDQLLAVAAAGELVRWDLVRGSLVGRTRLETPVADAALAPELDRIAVRDPDGELAIRDAITGARGAPLGEAGAFSALAWTPCGRKLATGTRAGDVTVWDPVSGRSLVTWWAHPAAVQSLTFDPAGTVLASGGADGRISLWQADTGKRTLRVMEPGDHPHGLGAATRAGSPRSLMFTGGGAYVVGGLTGGGLFLWDRESGHRLWTPPGHSGPVRCVRSVHGGLSIASAGGDSLVLWDALTGESLALLAGHVGPVAALAVTPDGFRLASAGPDPFVLLWDLPSRSTDMSEPACRRALALYAHRALERLGGPRSPD